MLSDYELPDPFEQQAAQPQQSGGGTLPAMPRTQAELDALPPGTRYVDPGDGLVYTKD